MHITCTPITVINHNTGCQSICGKSVQPQIADCSLNSMVDSKNETTLWEQWPLRLPQLCTHMVHHDGCRVFLR